MKIKNILAISMIFIFTFFATSCSQYSGNGANSNDTEIALIITVANPDDKSYNQSAWEEIQRFCKENNKKYGFYQASEKNDLSIENAITEAINDGAKVIVAPGVWFKTPIYDTQTKYPDVKFIMTDAIPTSSDGKDIKIAPNTTAKIFAEYEAGYLAGFVAVKEGYKNLGFAGGSEIDAIKRFGFGFVQGANDAAKDMNLAKNSINIKYGYIGTFEESINVEDTASSLYSSDTDVIFACAGEAGVSVMKSAEKYDKYVIGVDIDQSFQSTSVITSAKKNVGKVIYEELSKIYSDKFEGGKEELLTVKSGDISLHISDRLKKFKQSDFDAIAKKISSGEVKIMNDTSSKLYSLDKSDDYIKITVF